MMNRRREPDEVACQIREILIRFAPMTLDQLYAAAVRVMPDYPFEVIRRSAVSLFRNFHGFFIKEVGNEKILSVIPDSFDLTNAHERAVWVIILAYLSDKVFPNVYRDRRTLPGATQIKHFSFLVPEPHEKVPDSIYLKDYDLISVEAKHIPLANHFMAARVEEPTMNKKRFIICVNDLNEAEEYILPAGHKYYFAIVTPSQDKNQLPSVRFYEPDDE